VESVLSQEHRLLQQNVRQFMVREVEPLGERIDREDRFPPGIWKKLGQMGLLGVTIPEEYGGSGFDVLAAVLIAEQMARVCPALALSYTAHSNLCAHNLHRNGTEEQRRKYLPGLCSGDLIGCLALTEPNAGSDAVGITTSARQDGSGFVLNGRKTFITNAPVADVFLIYAKTDKSGGARGITTFILDRGTPGLEADRELEKMSNRGSPTGEIVLEDCRVDGSSVLGQVDGGIGVMMSGLDVERVVVAGIPLGLAQGALEAALAYARQREQFGRPICDFQLVKAKLADTYTEIEAARGLVHRAACLADDMERGGKGTEVHKIAAAALLFAGRTAIRAADEAVQIHGGYGLMLEFPVNRFYRDAKLYEIGAGTSEIRRLVIAQEIINRGLGYV